MKKCLALFLIVLLGLLVTNQALAGGKKPALAEVIRLQTIPIADSLARRAVAESEAKMMTALGAKGDTLDRKTNALAGSISAVHKENNLFGTRLDALELGTNSLGKAVQGNADQITNLGLTVNQSLAAQKGDLLAQLVATNQAQEQKIAAQGQEIETLKTQLAKRSAWRIPRIGLEAAVVLAIFAHIFDHGGRG